MKQKVIFLMFLLLGTILGTCNTEAQESSPLESCQVQPVVGYADPVNTLFHFEVLYTGGKRPTSVTLVLQAPGGQADVHEKRGDELSEEQVGGTQPIIWDISLPSRGFWNTTYDVSFRTEVPEGSKEFPCGSVLVKGPTGALVITVLLLVISWVFCQFVVFKEICVKGLNTLAGRGKTFSVITFLTIAIVVLDMVWWVPNPWVLGAAGLIELIAAVVLLK